MEEDKAYLKAEWKIEEAARSGSTVLDLENMGLTELPTELEPHSVRGYLKKKDVVPSRQSSLDRQSFR